MDETQDTKETLQLKIKKTTIKRKRIMIIIFLITLFLESIMIYEIISYKNVEYESCVDLLNEKTLYNYRIKKCVGNSVKASEVKLMIEDVISQNNQYVNEAGRFISIEGISISEFDSTALNIACEKASFYDGGENTQANIDVASAEMRNLELKIKASKTYKVTADYEAGIIIKVEIEEIAK